MAKREELAAKYRAELSRLGITPDHGVLMQAVKACGPSIYRDDSETVAAGNPDELARVRQNFIMKRLGITDAAQADSAMDAALDTIGRSNRNKYRAVLYYLIATQTGLTDRL